MENYNNSNSDRLTLLFDNLSFYFVGCVLLAIATTVIVRLCEKRLLPMSIEKTGPSIMSSANDDDCQRLPTGKDVPTTPLHNKREMVKRLEASLSEEQRQTENEARRHQLDAIFQLLKSDTEKYGVESMEDVEQQLKLYQ